MLRQALQLFASDPAVPTAPSKIPVEALIAAAQAELHQAQAAIQPLERRLEQAEAAVARVQAVMDSVHPAERAADEAAAAAAASTRAWAEGGARHDTAGDQTLLDAASDARRHADQVRLQAQGATAGLPVAKEAVVNASVELDQGRQRVRAARIGVLMAMAQRDFEVLEAAHAARLAAYRSICGLREMLRAWGPAHAFAAYADPTRGDYLEQQLAAATMPPLSKEELSAAAAEWMTVGQRLSNTDASVQ